MKRLLLWLVLSLMPSTLHAQGIDLTWKDCVGTGNETLTQTFACTGTVNQSYTLIFQFKLPVHIPNFVGMAAYADYQNNSHTPLTPFWHYESGGCNNTGSVKGIAMFDNIQLLPNCAASFLDAWDGDGSGGFEGIAAYGVDFRRPGNGYFILGDARATAIKLEPYVNYYAFHLVFNNRNRTACAGCTDQGCILFQRLELESNDGSPRVDLESPDKMGQIVAVNQPNYFACIPPDPVERTSWKGIKSLYR